MSTSVRPPGAGDRLTPPALPKPADTADQGSMPVIDQAQRAMEQRRTFPRIPCRVLVDYVVDGLAYRDCIANISEGGAFIETSHAVETGSPVTLSFSLFEDRQPVKVTGHVAWAGATGVGVRFQPNQTITQFCFPRDNASAPPPPESETPPLPAPRRSGQWTADVPPRRAPRDFGATFPLWVAVSVIAALVMLSRFETNSRIKAVADKVDRAAESLVQLQSIAVGGGAVASHTSAVQPAVQPEPPAPRPSPGSAGATAEQRATTVESAASTAAPREQAPTERVAAADTVPVPDRIYIVQEGDNLYRIAQRLNVSRTILTEYNGLAQPDRILIGQRIRVPAEGR